MDGPPIRVLVVDDNSDNADSLAELLRVLLKCEVTAATDGPACIELVQHNQPDLVLLDLAMPRMDGFAVREAISGMWPACLTVALTGYGDQKMRERCKEAGFHHHELKPVRVERLRQLVSEAARLRGPHYRIGREPS